MPDEHGILPGGQVSPPSSTEHRQSQARRYGFACSNCRRRKARCNGALPACRKCEIAGETCRYDNRPSISFVAALQHQLKSYQERFEQLRQVKSDDERAALLAEPIATEGPRGGNSRAPSSIGANALTPEAETTAKAKPGEQMAADVDSDDLPGAMSLGADGQVYFYGQTSLYRLDEDDPKKESNAAKDSTSPDDRSLDRQSTRNAEQHELKAFLSEIPTSLLDELMETYWCWPHHLHCVLSKKVFLRDLWALGPFVTPFLLSAVLAQATRYSRRKDATELGEHFAKRALQLLVADIDRGSSIPTIQGLLIFSARDCACGRTSQGWLYSGMAFRMARDLGLHVAPKKIGPLSLHFSEEDLALRHQLFWSCYTWDKTMSLCLGRAPMMVDTIEFPTADSLLDGIEADNEIWQPMPARSTFYEDLVRQRSLSSTRFVAYCKLCVIINGVLDELYSRPHRAQRDRMLAYLTQTLDKLDEWSRLLPPELSILEDTKAVFCPPLHILLLNLLYHTTAILLCRPYRSVSNTAKMRCTQAARMTDLLFTMHVRRFGFQSITWLQTYTMFVACTINVRDFKECHQAQHQGGNDSTIELAREASARLDFGLEVLRQASSTPSAGRCAFMIARLLQTNGGGNTETTANQQGQGTGAHGQSREELLRGPSRDMPAGFQPCGMIQGPSAPLETQLISTQSQLTGTNITQNMPFSGPELPALGNELTGTEIEMPFQFLPENVYDDGSWMLTDADLTPWPVLNMTR